MIKNSIKTSVMAAAFLIYNPAFAQMAPYSQQPGAIKQPHMMPPPAEAPMKFADFPSAEELARMTPPKPMTEEKIKQRFAQRKTMLNKVLEKDRKAAEKYAQEFSRYQKHQSDSLAQLMARAEKRREQMLQRLDEQEQRVLENFRKRTAPAANQASSEVTR